MLLVDEGRLRKCDIELLGNAYGMKYDHSNWNEETYDAFIDSVVEELYVNVDDMVEGIVENAMEYIKEWWPSIKRAI